jgi:outer membrane protein assembly factor BamB
LEHHDEKVVIAVLCLMIAGCGIIDRIRGKDDELAPLKPNPLPEINQEAAVDRVWTFNIGGEKQSGLRPALGGNSVYIANPDGDVAAVNLDTGRANWRTRLDVAISGGVGTGEGLVMVGGLNGDVVALDARDGSEAWRTRVDSEVLAPPRATAGTVVVRTIDGRTTGLSAASGEPRWNLQRDEPSLTLRGISPPLLDQNVAVLGYSDGKLAAVNVTRGNTLWEIPVARPSGTNEVERMVDVDAMPMLVGNVLYAVSYQGSITAYAIGENRILWTREMSSHTDFTVDADNVYISDSLGRVHALDRATGEEKWVQDQLLRRRLSGPAQVGDYVLVGDYDGYLHVLHKSDGRLLGRSGFRTGSRPSLWCGTSSSWS